MKKLYLPALLLLVFCSCTNNQETVDKGKINSVETRSVEVKSVRDYIESDEFISIIPDEYYALRQKGKMSEEEIKAADYQMKAAAYRFYKHCTMDDKGFITCNVTNGAELKISEEVFEFRLRDMKGWNEMGSPDKSGGKFFNSIENLHLCTMNNQGLLALAQLILPSEILSNFEVVRVEEEASLIRIYLDESVKAEYKENPEIESKGFCEAVTIRDFPIRDKGVDLIVRRRKWYDKQNNRYFSDSYDLKAEETRYSKEFAAFLKGVYGDDSYDLPFA